MIAIIRTKCSISQHVGKNYNRLCYKKYDSIIHIEVAFVRNHISQCLIKTYLPSYACHLCDQSWFDPIQYKFKIDDNNIKSSLLHALYKKWNHYTLKIKTIFKVRWSLNHIKPLSIFFCSAIHEHVYFRST